MQQPKTLNLLGKISDKLRQGRERRLLELVLLLVIKAYRKMYEEGHYKSKWKENKFTQVLKFCIKQYCFELTRSTGKILYVGREYYKDDEDVIFGESDPDAVPRIDIIIVTWKRGTEIIFPFECKKISEQSSKSIEYYIKKGLIDRYLTDKDYSAGKPWGGMIGYILRGNHNSIVSKLNEQITCQLGRSAEHLQILPPIDKFEAIYKSEHHHPNQIDALTITHLFLTFLPN